MNDVLLDEQMDRLQKRGTGILVRLGFRLITNSEFRAEVLNLSSKRLLENYKRYGDRMYKWPALIRDQNKLEELADYVNYESSDPIDVGATNH